MNFNMIPIKVARVSTKNRTIQTMLPVPESLPLFESLEEHESRSMHGQIPVVWDSASGAIVSDPYGNRWIDFTSTIFVTNVGHGHPSIVNAIKSQLEKPLLHTYTFVNSARVRFIKKLLDLSPKQFEKAYMVSSGTEATEAALKLMRLYGQKTGTGKIGIIAFRGSMHGRTMGAEMLKGMDASSRWLGYADPNIHHMSIPFPWMFDNYADINWEKRFEEDVLELMRKGVRTKNLCGFIIEPYIGWSAYFFPKRYIQALVKFAMENDILVAFDEIQSGFGRTGKMYAYQHYGVEPDLVCLGKGMSSSLPLAGVIGRKKIMDVPEVGSMSSTHSANPLSCAAGLANLEVIQNENLVAESTRKGKILHDRLNGIRKKFSKRIKYVFGEGLLAGVLFAEPATGSPDSEFPSQVCELAAQKGVLLVHTGRESIKFGPPLSIPDDALLEGIDVFEESLEELDKKTA